MRAKSPPAGKATQLQRFEAFQSPRLQIEAQNLAARLLGQPGQNGCVAHRLETHQADSAAESRRLGFASSIDDRGLLYAGVLRIERKGFCHTVLAAAKADLDTAHRQPAGGLQCANRVAGTLQGSQRAIFAAWICIVAVGGNVKRYCRPRSLG